MDNLVKWFSKNRRKLPWREVDDPYAVWISEVMLQQTQVAVVIPYFYKWMETFPTVGALAHAPIEQVIKVWEGLGYYSRARNLHAAARQIVSEFNGVLPDDIAQLRSIIGFGPYTAGAVASFAFGQRAPAVDGNVLRVMSRYLAYEEDITKAKSRTHIEQEVLKILPDRDPQIVMEGLIELGALVCKKNPLCTQCPLKAECRGFNRGIEKRLPNKPPRVKTTQLNRQVACVFSSEHVLLSRGKKGRVMQDLWEFPYAEEGEELNLPLDLIFVKKLPQTTHTFTRFRASLYPTVWRAKERVEIPGFTWTEIAQIHTLPFSSGHKKILRELI